MGVILGRTGGQSVGYQARKKVKTTNNIFFCDNSEQILAMDSPKAGNHHNLMDIEVVLKEILTLLESAKIETKGLFINADSGFDNEIFRQFLERKEIIVNIPKNPRNRKKQEEKGALF